MDDFLRDIRFGLRMLTHNLGFSIITVLILAVGISAGSAIFSVAYSVLVRPLPYANSDRLMMLWGRDAEEPKAKSSASNPDLDDWRSQGQSFDRIEAFNWANFNLVGMGEPERLPVMQTSAGFLDMLGVQPLLGRTFTTGEDNAGSGRVVILSNRLWKRRFDASPSVLEKTMPLNGESYTIIGVMPPGFAESFVSWPDSPLTPPELWTPIQLDREEAGDRAARNLYTLGRLKSGVGVSSAQAEMNAISSRLSQQYAETNRNMSVSVASLHEDIVGDVRPTLRVLLGAAGFLLLIAYANVATLLLAHAARRQREISIRMAVGASRLRVVRQLLTESLLLSLISCALGLLLAYWLVQTLIAISPSDVPRVSEVNMDVRVLALTVILSIVTAVIFGMLPAYYSSKTDLSSVLAQSQGNVAHHPLLQRARTFLVIFELSAALLLLIGAMLMVRSFMKVQSVDTGITAQNVLTTRLLLPPDKYPEDYQKAAFFKQLLQKISALPGVQRADAAYSIPFGAGNAKVFFTIEGRQPPTPDGWPPVDFNAVSPDFFQTLGIALRDGRSFTETDTDQAPKAVILNEAMARRYWPGQSAVGKQLSLDMPGRMVKDLLVVGVVADVRQRGLDQDVQPCIYVPYLQFPGWARAMHLLVRTSSAPLSLAPGVRQAIWSLDKDQPMSTLTSIDQLVSTSVASRRFNMVLLQLLAGGALFLALGGVYGLMSYLVMQRMKEIAIRMALGAQPKDVMKSFVSRSLKLIATGVIVGLTVAYATTRLMESLLFGISTTDTMTFLVTSAVLTLAALAATIVPARRAMRVSPASVLRQD